VSHRHLPIPGALSSLPTAPSGDVLDAAYQAAGLAVPTVPRYPAVEVLWSGDTVPQPVAVVVECSEAMSRRRPMPTPVNGPADPSAGPGHKWWAAVDKEWLSLQVSTTVPGPGEPPQAPVAKIILGPGATRAVVLLAPGARGTELRLDLAVAADELAGTAEKRAEAVRAVLHQAPWEVED
jgi:hypothetical protein